MKKQIFAAVLAAMVIGAGVLTGCSGSSGETAPESASREQIQSAGEESAPQVTDAEREAILSECQKTGDAFFKDFAKMEGVSSNAENEAYLKGLVKYFTKTAGDMEYWATYAPISLEYREFYKDGYRAEFKILSYMMEKADIRPDLDKAVIEDNGDFVTIPYTVKILPGKDVFDMLKDKDLLDWFSQWYDKALPKVLAAVDEMEPITKTVELDFHKEDGAYKIDSSIDNLKREILCASAKSTDKE